MIHISPLNFTLNQSQLTSEEFDVVFLNQPLSKAREIYPMLSGEFDGATVIIEQFVSDFQGWQPVQWRQDELTSNTIVFSASTSGDRVFLATKCKFRFVCNNPTALTNIKVSVAW